VGRVGANAGGGSRFDDPAQVHDRDVITELADDGQIVRDEEVAKTELALKIGEQVEDLRLDGDVQGAYRLVADYQTRLRGQCAGDSDPLALPAGELVGIAPGVFRLEADAGQQISHPTPKLLSGGESVHDQTLADDPADGHPRVQTCRRVLEDGLDLPANTVKVSSPGGQ
jgi:hypothetical protein